jgi:baculoviral IAP repeat-containing protein 6
MDLQQSIMDNLKLANMKYISQTGNRILYELGGNQQFYITTPQNYGEYYFVELPIVLDGFAWLNKVNEFIFNKNPDLQILVNHIESKYTKQKQSISDKTISNKDIFNVPDLEINMFDLEERRYRIQLKELLVSMKSDLNLNIDASDKTPALFSGKIPGILLMNEFFELRKKYSKNTNVQLTLENNNIYNWNLKFTNFTNQALHGQLQKLKENYGYEYIEIEIHFHDKLYPAYPPFIRAVRPRLDHGLMNRITNMKMVHLDYWSPCRGMAFIVNKLNNALNKHCVIEIESDMNDSEKYKTGAYHSLEAILVKLAALCDEVSDTNHEPLDTEVYNKIHITKSQSKNVSTSKNTSKKTVWAKGTGYGHAGASDWDPNDYIRMQEEKDKQIKSVLSIVMDALHSYKNEELPIVYNIIRNSYLIPFIKSYLQGTNMLEMGKRFEMYQFLILFMQILTTEKSIFLFDSTNNSKGIYEILKGLYQEAQQVMKLSKMDEDDDAANDTNYDVTPMICTLYEMIDPIFKLYMENKQKFQNEGKEKWNQKMEKAKSNLDKGTSGLNTSIVCEKHEKYNDIMGALKFDTAKFKSPYVYSDKLTGTKPTKMMTKRLAREYASMINSLPIFFESSIFVRVSETDNRSAKILITGPEGTPYDSGCFLFDLYTGNTYPECTPTILFTNSGNVRFNPNLYNCGKVCLSLLGTWSGSGGEKWNPKTSTLQQLFISIQSQILIENPYYNEPSYESSYNNAKGQETSRQYNNQRRLYTLKYTMYDLITNLDKYPEFADVIKDHFILKKDYILELCEKWKAEPKNKNEKDTIEMTDKLKIALEKLV